MRQFTCYNKFLLGVHNAQIINEKQMKAPSYFHFIEKVIEGQKNGNQTVYDYLALPSQRVGRYTMYFKGKQHDMHPMAGWVTHATTVWH